MPQNLYIVDCRRHVDTELTDLMNYRHEFQYVFSVEIDY